MKLLILVSLLVISVNTASSTLPIVLWHGMGDTCCFPFSLGAVTKFLKSKLNNPYVTSIEIGGNIVKDYESGFFVHPNKQIEETCKLISNNPKLANGYNAIGFSQGGQFLRAVAQRCPSPLMVNLITLGGQHQGIFGLPNCPLSFKTCEYFRELLNFAAYREWVQEYLVQATYWHDPLQEDMYVQKSTFIAEINNEQQINQTYIDNLQKLQSFVMVKFRDDTIVQPKDTQWFEFYKPGQDQHIVPFNESEIFIKDKLGLQQMYYNGKLIFLESPGNHLQFSQEWFIENIIPILNSN